MAQLVESVWVIEFSGCKGSWSDWLTNEKKRLKTNDLIFRFHFHFLPQVPFSFHFFVAFFAFSLPLYFTSILIQTTLARPPCNESIYEYSFTLCELSFSTPQVFRKQRLNGKAWPMVVCWFVSRQSNKLTRKSPFLNSANSNWVARNSRTRNGETWLDAPFRAFIRGFSDPDTIRKDRWIERFKLHFKAQSPFPSELWKALNEGANEWTKKWMNTNVELMVPQNCLPATCFAFYLAQNSPLFLLSRPFNRMQSICENRLYFAISFSLIRWETAWAEKLEFGRKIVFCEK